MSEIFAVEETINAPVHVVWAHLTEPEKLGLWMPAIEHVHTANGEHTSPENPLRYRLVEKNCSRPSWIMCR